MKQYTKAFKIYIELSNIKIFALPRKQSNPTIVSEELFKRDVELKIEVND